MDRGVLAVELVLVAVVPLVLSPASVVGVVVMLAARLLLIVVLVLVLVLGLVVRKEVKECSSVQAESSTTENGRMTPFMAMELCPHPTGANLRVNGEQVKRMAEVIGIFQLPVSVGKAQK